MIADFARGEVDLYKGGVMQANYRLVSALAKRDDLDLHVLTSSRSVVNLETRKFGNATIVDFPPGNAGFDTLLLYYGLRKSLNKLLAQLKPDLVHAQGVAGYIFAALRTKLPCIVTVHGVFRNELPVLKSRMSFKDRVAALIIKQLESYNFSRTQNLIAITSEIETLVKTRSPNVRVFRIDNAIDDGFLALADQSSKPVILFVGWVAYRKGVHLLLEALRRLIHAVPGVEVRIAGLEDMDPDYGPLLRAEYADLIRAGHISFVGAISQAQLYEELSKCSLLCLPSLADSAPMVIAEAMAAGKPVVASRVGGIPGMVEDGMTGKLFERGDVSALTACLGELLLDIERLKVMGKQARQVAQRRYCSKGVAEKTVAAYRTVLGVGPLRS